MQHNPPYRIQEYTVYPYDTLPSTADMAKQDMFQDVDAYIIVADTQLSGRGRLGNGWQGDTGNVFFNMVTQLDIPMQQWSQLSLVIALALSDVISNVLDTAAKVQIKWPNDILVNGAKIAGVLLETIHTHTPKPKLSMGIGVNIVSSPPIDGYPTCYIRQFGGTISATDTIPMIVNRYTHWLQAWHKNGMASIVSLWLARAWGMGNTIRVRTPQKHIHGVFVGLSPSGELLLQTTSGNITVNAGEVVFG